MSPAIAVEQQVLAASLRLDQWPPGQCARERGGNRITQTWRAQDRTFKPGAADAFFDAAARDFDLGELRHDGVGKLLT